MGCTAVPSGRAEVRVAGGGVEADRDDVFGDGVGLFDDGVFLGNRRRAHDGARSRAGQAAATDRPGAFALIGQHPFGDGDLLLAGGQICRRGEFAAAMPGPGAGGKLQPALVAVAGVDGPVAAGLATGHPFPFGVGCRGCLGGATDEDATKGCSGEGDLGDVDR